VPSFHVSGLHVNDGGLHAVIEAFDVYAKNAVEVFFGSAFDRADVRDAGVVDEDREALARKELLEECVDLLPVGDVTAVSDGISAGGSYPLAGGFGLVEIDIEDAERGSVGSELARDRAADSAASAGNDGDSAVEAEGTGVGGWCVQRGMPRFQGMTLFFIECSHASRKVQPGSFQNRVAFPPRTASRTSGGCWLR
jgi:hypothetical protein